MANSLKERKMIDHQTLGEAKQVCPTTTQRLVREGALLVDVRERTEVASLAFDVPAIVNIPLFEMEQRWGELPKDRELVLVCESGERSLKATYYLQFRVSLMSNMERLLKWMRKEASRSSASVTRHLQLRPLLRAGGEAAEPVSAAAPSVAARHRQPRRRVAALHRLPRSS
jgi:rhodanese-related sulfurtransferase